MIPSFDEQVRWGLALPFFVGAALLQAALIPLPGLFGARADLVLILAASWAVVRSCEEAMVAAPPAALLVGLLGAGPMGVPLLGLLAPLALALALRSSNPNPKLASVCIVVALSTLAAVTVELIVRFLNGEQTFNLAGIGTVLAGETIANTVLAAIVYRFLCIGRKRRLARRTRLSLS